MTNIRTETFGQGEPLILLHGWAMHSGVWFDFAQQLAKKYTVTCVDLPGHGFSHSVEPYTLEYVCEALVRELPDAKFALLGWSLGASVAIQIACQYPERVNKLILLAGNPCFVEQPKWPGMKKSIFHKFAQNLSTNCAQTMEQFMALQVARLDEPLQIIKILKKYLSSAPLPTESVLTHALAILEQADLRKELHAIQCPVISIFGEKDVLVPVQVDEEMQKIIPDYSSKTIVGAGHAPFLTHSTELIDSLDAFL